MRRGLIAGVVAVVLMVGSASVLVGIRAGAAGWVISPTANPTLSGGRLTAVSCASAQGCVAVGMYSDPAGNQVTLAERSSGSSWAVVPTPRPPAQVGGFEAVSCLAARVCTAVGYGYDLSGIRITLAERWNGTAWTIQATPNPAGARASSLSGVSCASASTCTAVGSSTTGGALQVPLAEQWNGTSWAILSTPAPAGAKASSLLAVACASPDVCSAVGSLTPSTSNAAMNFAEQGAGTTWTIAATPTTSSAGPLVGVSCADEIHCVAVGYRNANAETETWNGIRWRMAPNHLARMSLSSVSCTAVNACTAAGSGVARWDGTNWTQQTAPTPAHANAGFSGVACAGASACTMAGSGFLDGRDQPLVDQWNGTSWTMDSVLAPSAAAYSSELSGVSCTSTAHCFAVGVTRDSAIGDRPLAEQWNGTSWSILSIPNPGPSKGYSSLNGVSCAAADMCMAVGMSDGNALAERWDGTAWVIQSMPAIAADLISVSCASPTSCTAAGSSYVNSNQVADVGQWNGTSWSLETLPLPAGTVQAELRGVSCAAVNACVAVGYATPASNPPYEVTLAEQWNGTSWSILPTPNPSGARFNELRAVACSTTGCAAVGDSDSSSLAEQWNGTSWGIQPTPTPSATAGSTFEYVTLEGVTCTAPTACAAVGSYVSGTTTTSVPSSTLIDRWNGTAWVIDPSPSPIGALGAALVSVACFTDGDCVAVGGVANTSEYDVTLAEHYSA